MLVVYYRDIFAPIYSIATSFSRVLPFGTKNYDRTLRCLVLVYLAWTADREAHLELIRSSLASRQGRSTIGITFVLWFFEEVITVAVDGDDIVRGNHFDEYLALLPRLLRVFQSLARPHYRLAHARTLSQLALYEMMGHPIIDFLRRGLEAVDEVTVELENGKLGQATKRNAANANDSETLAKSCRTYIVRSLESWMPSPFV